MQVEPRWKLWVGIGVLLILMAACATETPPVNPTSTPRPSPTVEVAATETTEEPAVPAEGLPKDPAGRDGWYDAPPEMQINLDKYYAATLETDKGEIVVELFAQQVPQTINNFVFLAREGFYDNTTFHRVIPDFMVQGGDPAATGLGGPGYTFTDEFDPTLGHDRAGILSMANSGPGTNGSQFFITFGPTTWLDDKHTVFGKIIAGLDVLHAISPRDPETATTPGDALMSITIEESAEPFASQRTPNAEIAVPEEAIARYNLYSEPPEMQLDETQQYSATIITEKGEIKITLDAEIAPVTVNNFVFLAEAGFYDGLTFHRVEPEFVIQGGDPTGSGQGGPGYVLPAEIGLEHSVGAIAMARLPDQGNPRQMSSGSQFYITLQATPQLDGAYTVFGYVTEGLDVVNAIAVGDVIEEIKIERE
ncbi:MAG: peptidylprolyl isomerase [Chloroflexota bacterium]|nr:peptidylprolyl isomerase [Chloroflexota bacterium]